MPRLITKQDVLFALGFTPYDVLNPAQYATMAFVLANGGISSVAPTFTGTATFSNQVTILGLADLRGGLLNLSSTTPRLLLGQPGSPSTPAIDFLALSNPVRAYDARISVSGGNPNADGQGVINLSCSALTINGNSIATTGTGAPGTSLPLVNRATALVGSSVAFSREDHVHPSDTTRMALNAASVINDPATGNVPTLTISAVGNLTGAQLKLVHTGTTKTIRNSAGVLIIADDTNANALVSVSEGGQMTIGYATATTAQLAISGAAGSARQVRLQTAGVDRWRISAATTSEAGSNSGSDFAITACDDSGSFISTPFQIARGTGLVRFGAGVQVTGALTLTDPAATSTTSLDLSSTGNSNGINIKLTGNGSTTPSKYIRVISGRLEIVSSSYGAVLASLTDAGAFTAASGSFGTGGFSGTVTAPQFTATAAGVILGVSGFAGGYFYDGLNAAARVPGTFNIQNLAGTGGAGLLAGSASFSLGVTAASYTASGAGLVLGLTGAAGQGVFMDNASVILRVLPGGGSVQIQDTTGAFQSLYCATANIGYQSGFNYLFLRGFAPGSSPDINVNGPDANINLTIRPKGSGALISTGPIIQGTSQVAVIGSDGRLNVAQNPVGYSARNFLTNGRFTINQRNPGSVTTTNGFPADRWQLSCQGGSNSSSLVAVSDADRTAIGNELATTQLLLDQTGSAGSTDYSAVTHRIEGIRRLSGKTVTLSFWARTRDAGGALGIEFAYLFGSGGSPSSNVFAIGSQSIALSQTWTRYSITLTLPSSQGKTLGTNNDDSVLLSLYQSAGASYATRAGNIGVRTQAVYYWGMQLEVGTAATALEALSPQRELAECQRYYQWYSQVLVSGYAAAGVPVYGDISYSVPMRALPSIAFAAVGYGNASALVVNQNAATHLRLATTVTTIGSGLASADILLSAEL